MTDQVPVPETARPETETEGHSASRLAEILAPKVFSDPVQSGDRVVVTAAAVQVSGGLGGPEGAGGGHSEGRPVAVIEVAPDGVRVRPLVDYTRLAMTAVGIAFAIWRITRARRSRSR
jgi:uncharacterized spore protein YtfJ